MSDGIGSIIGYKSKPKTSVQSAGAHLALNPKVEKDENTLSNKNLPGGIFTHPQALT